MAGRFSSDSFLVFVLLPSPAECSHASENRGNWSFTGADRLARPLVIPSNMAAGMKN